MKSLKLHSNFKKKYLIVSLGIILSQIAGSSHVVFAKYDQTFFSNNNILIYNPDDRECSTSGGTVSELSGKDNREKIWNYLGSRGLSPEQTAGVMGNMQSESAGSWNPMVNEYSQEFGEGGFGIVQWTGGRRNNIVSYLNEKHKDLMDKYYNENYSFSGSATSQSDGFIPRNIEDDVLMPVEDNDAILLAELEFLYDESQNRNIGSGALSRGYGASGEKEWDVLKQQKSIKDASNVWVYSFEIPADIDNTALVRANNGEVIFDNYSSSTDCFFEASKKELASQIVNSGNFIYTGSTSTQDRTLLPNIVNGSTDGNSWPCGMNIIFLKAISAIVKEHRLEVNSLNRACSQSTVNGVSSTKSRHYAGNGSAVDFESIDGIKAETPAGASLILKYLGPLLVSGSNVGQLQCLPSSAIPALPDGVNRIDDTCNHLHVDVPPNVDLNLKCTVPIWGGGCDESQRI